MHRSANSYTNVLHEHQRISKVVFGNHRVSVSKSRLTGASSLLFIFALGILSYALFATQVCDAQTADEVRNQAPYQQAGQPTDQQTLRPKGQQEGQTTDQQTAASQQIIDILQQEPEILASVKIQ